MSIIVSVIILGVEKVITLYVFFSSYCRQSNNFCQVVDIFTLNKLIKTFIITGYWPSFCAFYTCRCIHCLTGKTSGIILEITQFLKSSKLFSLWGIWSNLHVYWFDNRRKLLRGLWNGFSLITVLEMLEYSVRY